SEASRSGTIRGFRLRWCRGCRSEPPPRDEGWWRESQDSGCSWRVDPLVPGRRPRRPWWTGARGWPGGQPRTRGSTLQCADDEFGERTGLHMNIADILERLEIHPVNSGACGACWIYNPSGGELPSINPATGSEIARVRMAGPADYDHVAAE